MAIVGKCGGPIITYSGNDYQKYKDYSNDGHDGGGKVNDECNDEGNDNVNSN